MTPPFPNALDTNGLLTTPSPYGDLSAYREDRGPAHGSPDWHEQRGTDPWSTPLSRDAALLTGAEAIGRLTHPEGRSEPPTRADLRALRASRGKGPEIPPYAYEATLRGAPTRHATREALEARGLQGRRGYSLLWAESTLEG